MNQTDQEGQAGQEGQEGQGDYSTPAGEERMHQVVAQQLYPDLGPYQVAESPVPSQDASVAGLQSYVVLAIHPSPLP